MKEELIQKYKKMFVFNQQKMELVEAKELLKILSSEQLTEETREISLRLRNYISKQEYLIKKRESEESGIEKANREFDQYHQMLKDRGVKVIQPGVTYNGTVDYLHLTYHYQGRVIYKWRHIKNPFDGLEEIKKVYEETFNENSSDM